MNTEKRYFLDDPANIRKLLWVFYGCCLVLLGLEFVVHRHVYHSWESLWGFYPLYGFVGCVVLVLIARWMRTFLMRNEDYYCQPEKPCQQEESRQPHEGAVTEGAGKGDHHVAD